MNKCPKIKKTREIQREKRNKEKPEGSTEISVEQFNYITSFFEAPDDSEGFSVKLYKE